MRRRLAVVGYLLTASCITGCAGGQASSAEPDASSPEPVASSPDSPPVSPSPDPEVDWYVAPGQLGPLIIGANGVELADAGFVVATSEDPCGSPYALPQRFYDESINDYGVYTEWRAGTSMDDLDGVLVKGRQFRTENGIGVGSTLGEIETLYGDELQGTTMDTLIDGMTQVHALFGESGALVFHFDEDSVVTSMQLLSGRPGQTLENMAVGC